jgi:rare lipoprotein A
MIRLPRRRFTKALTSSLYLLISFAIVIFVTGAINASAGDKPKSADQKIADTSELDIPGSFKDLSDAREAVAAKRSPEAISNELANNAASIALKIDAEKATSAAGNKVIAITDRSAVKNAVKNVAPAQEKAAAGTSRAPVITFPDSELVDFDATAYCLKGRTASGMDAKPGMIAADPRVLPLGTVVHLRAGSYTGTYKVMDTGGRIRGRRVDVYVASHREAMQFGRRPVKIKVLGRGAAKDDSTPKGLVAAEQ